VKRDYWRRFGPATLRVARWRLISALGVEAFHRVPGARFRMYLEPRFRSVGSLAVYSLGLKYEPALKLLPALLGPGEGFLDCGANQGVFALLAADLVGPTGRVVAIEPQSYAVRALRLSAAANDFQHLTVRQAAVSDQDGRALFGVGDEPVAASLAKPDASNAVLVETVRLDTILDDFGARGVHVLKLDVEGYEEAALRGAEQLLFRHRPHVIFEAYDTSDRSTQGAYDRLSEQGYEFFLPEKGALRPLRGERRESFNILAVHPSRKSGMEKLLSARS
jgi:FkbM family methyltransferase